MKTYMFIGKILPERENASISKTKVPIFVYKGDIIGEMTISILSSQILINADIDEENHVIIFRTIKRHCRTKI